MSPVNAICQSDVCWTNVEGRDAGVERYRTVLNYHPTLKGGLCSILLLLGPASAVTCGNDRPLTMCCMGLAPYYTNQNVWGSICGYYPQSTNELIGGRCISVSTGSSCPSGSISTCCAGRWPGPSGQCALGTNCGNPTAPPPPPPAVPAPIPDGWSTASSCASDNPSRIISNDVITNLADNTPATCIAHCSASGYAVAGVENGNECHCGTGFVSGAPQGVSSVGCSTRCSGNGSYTCGGAWVIQVYTGPSPAETYPAGWSVAEACAVDNASRVIANDVTMILDNNTPGACMEFCQAAGYTIAGVEYGDECHCGTGYTGEVTPAAAPASECNISCTGYPALTCGGGWRLQIYSSGA
ncbi:WSC-domain-containing protein [Trametopsis cervina]|nr:WSC-domain-containing protein [Trametopsis cervina]